LLRPSSAEVQIPTRLLPYSITDKMKSKLELIAYEALAHRPKVVVDIGYAQQPNPFLAGVIVYGVDIVEASAPYSKTFRCDLNIDKLPFQDQEIDVVTMGCTLAHVAHPLRVLADIHRVLKPGGRLVLSSPNPNYYWENVINILFHRFVRRVAKAKHEEHFFEFSRYNMRTIARRSGFEVTKELGYLLQLVKTTLRVNMTSYPGLAYEIIYVLEKMGETDSYATFEPASGGIQRIQTDLFS
jgi:SAM-dependent methyltransferase